MLLMLLFSAQAPAGTQSCHLVIWDIPTVQAVSGALSSMTQQMGDSPMPSPRPASSGPRQPLKPLVHSRAVLQETMREVLPSLSTKAAPPDFTKGSIALRRCMWCRDVLTMLDRTRMQQHKGFSCGLIPMPSAHPKVVSPGSHVSHLAIQFVKRGGFVGMVSLLLLSARRRRRRWRSSHGDGTERLSSH